MATKQRDLKLFDRVQITDRTHPWFRKCGEIVAGPELRRPFGTLPEEIWMTISLDDSGHRSAAQPHQVKRIQ